MAILPFLHRLTVLVTLRAMETIDSMGWWT